jgi:hypothetical protein
MRRSALFEHSPESLDTDEICSGKLMKVNDGGFEETSFDLLTAFHDALGKAVRDLPSNYEKGDLVTDDLMDLETNTTKTFSRENSLILNHGKVPARHFAPEPMISTLLTTWRCSCAISNSSILTR